MRTVITIASLLTFSPPTPLHRYNQHMVWSWPCYFPPRKISKADTPCLPCSFVLLIVVAADEICTHPPPRPCVESHLRLARDLVSSTHPLYHVAWIQSNRSTQLSTLRPSTKALTAALPSSHSRTLISDRGSRVRGSGFGKVFRFEG